MSNDEILTVKETAALLKTTRQQVRKMIANEELPAVKVGREWMNAQSRIKCDVLCAHMSEKTPYGVYSAIRSFPY